MRTIRQPFSGFTEERVLLRSHQLVADFRVVRHPSWEDSTSFEAKGVDCPRKAAPAGQLDLSEPFHEDNVPFGMLDAGKEEGTAVR